MSRIKILFVICLVWISIESKSQNQDTISVVGIMLDSSIVPPPDCGFAVYSITYSFRVLTASDKAIIGDTIFVSFQCPNENYGALYFINGTGRTFSFLAKSNLTMTSMNIRHRNFFTALSPRF